MSDEEKKSLITYLIKEIQIYPNGESEMPLKSIEFNFPIYIDGRQIRKVLWERGNTVDADVLLQRIVRRQNRGHYALLRRTLRQQTAAALFMPFDGHGKKDQV